MLAWWIGCFGVAGELATLLTALLAPVVCSLQVLLWRRLTPDVAVKKGCCCWVCWRFCWGAAVLGPSQPVQFWTIQLSPKFYPLIRSMLAEWKSRTLV